MTDNTEARQNALDRHVIRSAQLSTSRSRRLRNLPSTLASSSRASANSIHDMISTTSSTSMASSTNPAPPPAPPPSAFPITYNIHYAMSTPATITRTQATTTIPSETNANPVTGIALPTAQSRCPCGVHPLPHVGCRDATIFTINETMFKIGTIFQRLSSYERILERERWNGCFPQFSKLPLEIQLMIWEFAVPDPRQVRNAIVVVVNYDLGGPKAVIPKPKEYREIHETMFSRIARRVGTEGLDCDPSEYSLDTKKHVPFAMMQVCRNSRAAILKDFCLDIDFVKQKEDRKLPWEPDDVLYFPTLGYSFERRMALHWLSRERGGPHPALNMAQHIALPLERLLLLACRVFPVFFPRPGRDEWDGAWMKNLPNLKTFGLFVDPGEVSEKKVGELVLYEAEDVPIQQCSFLRPSEAEEAVQNKFKELVGEGNEAPVVDISVLCWKKPKGYKANSASNPVAQ